SRVTWRPRSRSIASCSRATRPPHSDRARPSEPRGLLGEVAHRRSALDLHAVVVEDRAAAHVGVTLVHGGVDGGAPLHEARPPALGAGDHTAPDAIADFDTRHERAAIVEYAHLMTGLEAPTARILGMDAQERRPRALHLSWDVGEQRVQVVVIGRRDQ